MNQTNSILAFYCKISIIYGKESRINLKDCEDNVSKFMSLLSHFVLSFRTIVEMNYLLWL